MDKARKHQSKQFNRRPSISQTKNNTPQIEESKLLSEEAIILNLRRSSKVSIHKSTSLEGHQSIRGPKNGTIRGPRSILQENFLEGGQGTGAKQIVGSVRGGRGGTVRTRPPVLEAESEILVN